MRLIDADELEKELEEKRKTLTMWEQQEGFDEALRAIEEAPTVERPHGEWEYVTHYARRFRVCSVCKVEKEDDRATGWNFCQYCGSDMRERKGKNEKVKSPF